VTPPGDDPIGRPGPAARAPSPAIDPWMVAIDLAASDEAEEAAILAVTTSLWDEGVFVVPSDDLLPDGLRFYVHEDDEARARTELFHHAGFAAHPSGSAGPLERGLPLVPGPDGWEEIALGPVAPVELAAVVAHLRDDEVEVTWFPLAAPEPFRMDEPRACRLLVAPGHRDRVQTELARADLERRALGLLVHRGDDVLVDLDLGTCRVRDVEAVAAGLLQRGIDVEVFAPDDGGILPTPRRPCELRYDAVDESWVLDALVDAGLLTPEDRDDLADQPGDPA
jgi:hypothetical protein